MGPCRRTSAFSSSVMGSTISWKTCLEKVRWRNSCVVVYLRKETAGGIIQPNSSRKSRWLPARNTNSLARFLEECNADASDAVAAHRTTAGSCPAASLSPRPRWLS